MNKPDDEVHLDREKIMGNSPVNYPQLYDQAITQISEMFEIPKHLAQKLQAKRAFGFQKYGERSFQGSFDNSIKTPSREDLLEELIDAINYSLHIQFQDQFGLASQKQRSIDDQILRQLINVYEKACIAPSQSTN